MKNKHVKSFEELNENKNLNISDVRQRALVWFDNLPKEKKNNLIEEKRPARAGYVDKGMINLTNKEIIELYTLHVV